MSSDFEKIRAGSWVRIKSATTILDSLDPQAMRGGLPFMPEMVDYCGQIFRVHRVTHNICGTNGIQRLSEFVVLQDLKRCDGEFHGGCQFGCKFLWHKDWLDLTEWDSDAIGDNEGKRELSEYALRCSKVDSVEAIFQCQATTVGKTAKPSSSYQLGQYHENRRDNEVAAYDLLKFASYVLKKKLLGHSDSLLGVCEKRTPVHDLKLNVGDLVLVNYLEDIRRTLDKKGCNRGLWFDREEMSKYCGQRMVVTRRIERIIDENTGRLIELKVPSVVLSEAECSGFFRRFCSRGMLFMWRECWLSRV